jgi:predicted porin
MPLQPQYSLSCKANTAVGFPTTIREFVMNKKLLSFAVAAAMSAPLAAQADVTIYGQIDMSVDVVDYQTSDDIFTWPVADLWAPNGNCALPPLGALDCIPQPLPYNLGIIGPRPFRALLGGGVPDFERDHVEVNSNASRLGFKGTEDLGNGLSAVWKIETEVRLDGDSGTDEGIFTQLRNAYLGLAHEAAGTLLLGRHDTPYKVMHGSWDLFAEGFADDDIVFSGGGGIGGFADRRANDVIAYISPTFAGITVAYAGIAGENNFDDGLFVDGAGYSIAASGNWGPIKTAIGYEELNEPGAFSAIGNPQGVLGVDRGINAPIAADRYADDDTLWGAGIAFDSSPFYVGLRYEDRESVGFLKGFDIEQWRLSAAYTLGNTTFKAMYHDLEGDLAKEQGSFEEDAWAIGVDHSLSKRTLLYASYVDVETDLDSQGIGFNQGPMFNPPLYRNLGAAAIGLAGSGLNQARLVDGDAFSLGIFHKF